MHFKKTFRAVQTGIRRAAGVVETGAAIYTLAKTAAAVGRFAASAATAAAPLAVAL